MADGDLVIEPYQWEYNGLLFGKGTNYLLTLVSGLLGYPAVRSGTVDRLGRHGGVAGRHYLPHREFYIKLDFATNSDVDFGLWRLVVENTFKPIVDPTAERPLTFWLPGGVADKMQIFCRPVDFNLVIDSNFNAKNPRYNIRFEATDPFMYGFQEHSAMITLAPDTTGLTFPVDFPLNFGASQANDVVVNNFGTADAHWKAVITGQVSGPRIEKVSTGEVLNFPGLEVESGHFLVLDSKERTALLDGTGNRRGDLSKESSWFLIDQSLFGESFRYSSNGPTSGSTLTVTWHWAYVGGA